jgi:hypothetical protein
MIVVGTAVRIIDPACLYCGRTGTVAWVQTYGDIVVASVSIDIGMSDYVAVMTGGYRIDKLEEVTNDR